MTGVPAPWATSSIKGGDGGSNPFDPVASTMVEGIDDVDDVDDVAGGADGAAGGGSGGSGAAPAVEAAANIITVAYPTFNSSASIKPCSLRVIRRELLRGAAITRKLLREEERAASAALEELDSAHEDNHEAAAPQAALACEPRRTWEKLFEQSDFFSRYPVYLRVAIRSNRSSVLLCDGAVASPTDDAHAMWAAFVSAKLLRFAESLHFTRKLFAHLHPRRYRGDGVGGGAGEENGATTSCYYIGLESEQRYQYERLERRRAHQTRAHRRRAGSSMQTDVSGDHVIDEMFGAGTDMDSDSDAPEPPTPYVLSWNPGSPLPMSPVSSRATSPAPSAAAASGVECGTAAVAAREATQPPSSQSPPLHAAQAPRVLSRRVATEVASPVIDFFLATEVHAWHRRRPGMECAIDAVDRHNLPEAVARNNKAV